MKTNQPMNYCEKCGRLLNEKHIVWLELSFKTDRYSESGVPTEESQGWFPFGPDCAAKVLANGGKLTSQ